MEEIKKWLDDHSIVYKKPTTVKFNGFEFGDYVVCNMYESGISFYVLSNEKRLGYHFLRNELIIYLLELLLKSKLL